MKLRSTLPVLSVLLVSPIVVQAQERSLGVRQPPETVFDVPVEEVMPGLSGALPTGENGRVGGELVFWGYRLADGSPVYLFACAIVSNVNCDERVEAICPTRTTVLERGEYSGQIVHRRCRDVAVAAPGDVRPGCASSTSESGLHVGIVSCD